LLGVPDSDIYGTNVDPIPPLPHRPEFPAPQITEKDLQDYIIPLYSRKWYISYRFKKGIQDTNTWYKSAVLTRNYVFQTFAGTMDFVTEAARLAQVEDVSF
jgi:hypothetical protein